MYLKQIEATGFKSFADKLSIALDDKTTCIVGPNGSGKSNIVDAVRWVLGEQSVKSLRGDGTMTDVIFSGSKSRNALNVASVTLTFDNSDHYLNLPYEEIAVRRRVYRSGENEYYLNGEKCRLKDVTDLFLDSGIGKESFNIISQGEVDKILSDSSRERRVIFEEAAGVLKYKKRKEEALRKLDRTHDNLERVEDIIEELSKQVEPLRKQSAEAKEYLENKHALEQYEVGLLVFDIERNHALYHELAKKMEEIKATILEHSSTGNATSASILEKKSQLATLEKELDLCHKSLVSLTEEVERLNSDKQLMEERSKYHKEDDKVGKQKLALVERKARLEKDLSVATATLEEHRKTLEQLNEQVEESKREEVKWKQKEDLLLKEYTYRDREAVTLGHEIETLSREIEEGGGVPYSVKSVLSSHQLFGIHDTIGNLVRTNAKYVKALEVALAGSRNFIVVDNEDRAKEAIYYLKENKKGRATFFPISVIRGRSVDLNVLEVLEGCTGYIDTMAHLVTYEAKYRDIIDNQLGNILLVDTLEHATTISKKIAFRYKIVTLDGDIIHVGGSMSGGSTGFQKSIISLRQELEMKKRTQLQLKESLKAQEEEYQRTIDKRKLLTEKVFQLSQSYALETENHLKEEEIKKELLRECENAEKEFKALSLVGTEEFSATEEQVIKAYYDAVAKKEMIIQEEKGKTAKIGELRETIEAMEAEEKVANSFVHGKEQELKNLEIDYSKVGYQLDTMLETLSEEYNLSFERAKEVGVLTEEIDEVRKKVQVCKRRIKELGMVNLGAIEEFERINTRYQFLISQREDLLKAKDTLLEIMDEMDAVMKEEFAKTFEAINTEFKEVFRELFHGGNALLKLTDPTDILETGIDIIASPPGKKLTTISLLSGGEKTLTAISLLFAILNVRTVPFCLFDEVEASLDEANVDQFGKYLDHYKHKTQFLIITHKQKTMEYADTLYGITMQESGVSKLVSVKLDKIAKENH